jgi:hypothetical protein
MEGAIERAQWKTFLDDFSKRNELRPSRIEVIGDEIGAQEEEEFLPLVGVSFEPKGSAAGSVEIILGGETAAEPRHMSHLIPHVTQIMPLVGIRSVEDGLGFENSENVKTVLRFEILPEIEDTRSTGR